MASITMSQRRKISYREIKHAQIDQVDAIVATLFIPYKKGTNTAIMSTAFMYLMGQCSMIRIKSEMK